MVEKSDTDELTRSRETIGETNIGSAWTRVATRMVVHGDDTRGRELDRRAKNLPRVDQARDERTPRDYSFGDQSVADIEQEDREDLLALVPKTEIEVSEDLIRAEKRPSELDSVFTHSTPEFERGHEPSCFRSADPGERHELFGLTRGEPAQTRGEFESLTAELEYGLPSASGPENQRDEFEVGQSRGTLAKQSLPRRKARPTAIIEELLALESTRAFGLWRH